MERAQTFSILYSYIDFELFRVLFRVVLFSLREINLFDFQSVTYFFVFFFIFLLVVSFRFVHL